MAAGREDVGTTSCGCLRYGGVGWSLQLFQPCVLKISRLWLKLVWQVVTLPGFCEAGSVVPRQGGKEGRTGWGRTLFQVPLAAVVGTG